MKKIFKISTVFLFLLSVFILPISAASKDIIIPDYDKNEYPYFFVVHNHTSAKIPSENNRIYIYGYYSIVASKRPLKVFDNNGTLSVKDDISSSILIYAGTNSHFEDEPNSYSLDTTPYYNESNIPFGLGNAGLFYTSKFLASNYDIYDIDDNLLFQNPLTPEVPPVTPDTSWTESLGSVFLKILIAVIGGMILLTSLWLLLRRLPSLFKNFGMR